MIVLDTNVLSEMIRPVPEPCVVSWLRAQARASMFTTAISRGEMLHGVLLLANGQRRQHLHQAVSSIFADDMAGRVLPYDSDAADAFAAITSARRAVGRPISQSDAMIAGIVHSHRATLATRNLRDFEDCGITLIDPWH